MTKIIKPPPLVIFQNFVSVFLLIPEIMKDLHKLLFVIILLLVVTSTKVSASQLAGNKPTNVVLILTDNHSPWTLGCYGNKEIRTPNIDRLAQEGILFERSYSCNPVCSPTRATLLTGLIPSQHGVHSYFLPADGVQIGPEAYNTIEEFNSLPEILSESGYVCGLTGKWHLGDNLNPHEGFSYWVTMPEGGTSVFYDADVIENGQIHSESAYLTDFWTDHAIRFIEQNKDKPFFLYLPYNGPYGLSSFLMKQARNRHAEYYADKQLLCFPREDPHPWLHSTREFINNIVPIRRYASEVSGIDDGVGRVMEALKRLNLDENTLVIFTSDQGHAGGHHGMWGMGDHSRPLHTFDETIHTPLIWRYPKSILRGERSQMMVSNYDLLPTLLTFLGLEEKIPGRPELPGRDYSAVLKGEQIDWENVHYYEYDNCRMIRTLEWKYTERIPRGGCIDEFYDLINDPGENNNLVNVKEYSEIKQQLQKKMYSFFDYYANPGYDLWQNGRSKTNLIVLDKPLIPPAKWLDKNQKW